MASYKDVLDAKAQEYKQWIENNKIRIIDFEDLEECLESGISPECIWTYKDFWDVESSADESISFRGAGYVPWLDSDDDQEPCFAISSKPVSELDKSCYSEVLIQCYDCDEAPDENCAFCHGDLEVRYDMHEDGTFSLAG
jgi:hypothetical protein